MMPKSIEIVIPAHNEEKRIGKTLEEYIRFFKKIKNKKEIKDFKIIIVINNTIDKTEDIVKEYSKKNKEVMYLNFKEKGKGFAIKKGFENALNRDADLIGFVDADMATSPLAFYNLIKNIGKYDGIIASRYIKGSVVKQKQPILRIMVSRIGNFIIRSFFLVPYKDTQCGAKLFKRQAIKILLPKLGMSQWAIDIDLLYQSKKSNLRIKESPTIWGDKGGSKLNVKKESIQVFLAVIQLRFLNSYFKRTWWIFSPLAKKIHRMLM